MHSDNDTDTSPVAGHHTLGKSHHQASFGDHNHDGQNSNLIFQGFTMSGSRGGNAAVLSIVNILKALGATDNTTP